jgi:ammonium transporter, Amt family
VGWFGFNGGSGLAIDSRAVNAVIVTNLGASLSGLTWILTEMLWNRSRKMSLYGFCNGVVAGLVCITPASGYVSPASSLVFGALGKFVFMVNN